MPGVPLPAGRYEPLMAAKPGGELEPLMASGPKGLEPVMAWVPSSEAGVVPIAVTDGADPASVITNGAGEVVTIHHVIGPKDDG